MWNIFDPIVIATALKLLVSGILGMLIGLERKSSHKEAGLRTFSLISMGCALFVLLENEIIVSQWKLLGANLLSIDPTRIIGQIVLGIGFLGAGLIIFHEKKVHGLTTAATVWVTAAIGSAVGIGAYEIAIIATIAGLFILRFGWLIEKKLLGLDEDDK